MDSFKKALKQAIVDKAEAVRFEVGRSPVIFALGEQEMNQLGPMDAVSLQTLIDSLLPLETSSGKDKDIREGSISIVNFGELKLLASCTAPLRLYAFIPPQGDDFFHRTKDELFGSKSQTHSIKPIDLPTMDDAEFESSVHRGQFALTQARQANPPPAPMETNPLPLPPTPQTPVEDDILFKTAYVPQSSDISRSDTQVTDNFNAAAQDLFGQPLSPLPAPVPRPLIPHMDIPSRDQADETLAEIPMPSLQMSESDEDYHFQTTNHSQIAQMTSFHQTPVLHDEPRPHAAPATIVFGSTIPGDSIERKGSLPIDVILEDMVKRRASDLHLTMDEPMCLRIDGEIVRLSDQKINEDQMRTYLLPIIPPRNREEFAKIHDTDFAYEVPGLARFRVNVFRDRQGVGAVLRQIPDKVLSADDLGLSPAIRKLCELHKGLVVVTGPTGSGKSTTLAAMVDLINETRTDHILTIEDPIEFVHKQKRCLINQREVHKHTGSFARALRAALREDPDIILIGEMRDLETVEIAIETAETGHLVFGTLHTNTAISTVDRLIDQFPADQQEQVRVMLAESLKGVVSQTLIKKKGGGRVAAQEILLVDKAVASLIREGNTHMVQNHMQTQKAKGNIQLNDALMTLVTKGLIDPRDAYMKSIEKEALVLLLQQKGINLDAAMKSVS